MLKEVVTVTFHCAHNYGAVLQAYALQNYIKETFPKVKTYCLDYRPHYLIHHLFNIHGKGNIIKNLMRSIITFYARFSRKKGFDNFINDKIESMPLEKIINPDGATYIVGSDQVWNRDLTGGKFDDIYLLSFSNSAYKYSFAASVGSDDDSVCKELATLLSNFKYIGVREVKTKLALEKAGVKNICVNVDPVFLLPVEHYAALSQAPAMENYVLVYTLETNDEVIVELDKWRGKYKTVSIGTFRNYYHTDKHFSHATPEQYIGLIENATYVISNSFHAIAFSVIFNRKFKYIPLKNGRGVRIENLLNILNMENNECLNVSARKERLNNMIEASKEYLKTIIEGTV